VTIQPIDRLQKFDETRKLLREYRCFSLVLSHERRMSAAEMKLDGNAGSRGKRE
jgi:hypothetical protein